MSGCPVHSSDDAATDRSGGGAIRARWDLIFLGMAVGMLALILAVALQLPG
jgi:hypothetical protein